MPRNLDSTLASHLGDPGIQPCVFAELTFNSGIVRVWSGVGDFVGPEGNTFTGLGDLASVAPVGEGTEVKAEGTSVTLSGIGMTLIDVPGQPTEPPPFSGQMAWSTATIGPGGGVFSYPPSIYNGMAGYSGSSGGTLTTGSVGVSGGQSLPQESAGLLWSGFNMPPEIPPDAIITGVYPVVHFSSVEAGGFMEVLVFPTPPGVGGIIPIAVGQQVGNNIESLGVSISAVAESTVPGSPGSIGMAMSFVGLAVYYTGTPRTKMSLLQEALGDIRLGAPAKIWFGLMQNGALLGVPYLVFSGQVDKPSIHTGLDILSITLALENRLVNLQRSNQRRYTAADQKIHFPDDMAFNWVESLNDIALRWGS